MAKSMTGGSPEVDMPGRCPWCSAEVPDGATTCPSCNANLTSTNEAQIPGLTAVDVEMLTSRKAAQKRSRLASWISGDASAEPADVAPPGSLDPPPPEVRLEMLRLEMEALTADVTAEAGARAADEAIEALDRGDETEARADIKAEADAEQASEAWIEAEEQAAGVETMPAPAEGPDAEPSPSAPMADDPSAAASQPGLPAS